MSQNLSSAAIVIGALRVRKIFDEICKKMFTFAPKYISWITVHVNPKFSYFFSISLKQNICCVKSNEPSHQNGSFENHNICIGSKIDQ